MPQVSTYSALLFDLDGTLLDTLEDLADATNRALAVHGFPPHPVDAFRHLVGDGALMLITRALPEDRRDPKTIDALLTTYKQEYAKNWYAKTTLYPGIADLLDQLTSRNLKLAVLSNKPHEFTTQCVSRFLSKWNWSVVLGQTNKIPRKPSPAGAIEVARRMNTPVQNFLYIGDTRTDMQTATAANMFPVGVLWGFRDREELQSSGARAIISHPSQLLTLCTQP
ncbi:MAG TPA: HAD family hydrolase [Tepidisphaeraceae bacterium]|jgi:phosphoglycolate phosphatase